MCVCASDAYSSFNSFELCAQPKQTARYLRPSPPSSAPSLGPHPDPLQPSSQSTEHPHPSSANLDPVQTNTHLPPLPSPTTWSPQAGSGQSETRLESAVCVPSREPGIEERTSDQRGQPAHPSEGPLASQFRRPGKPRCRGKERGGSSLRGWAGGLTEHLNVSFGDGIEAAAGKQNNVGLGGLGHGAGGCLALVLVSLLFLCPDVCRGRKEGEAPARMLWTPRSRSRRKPRHSPPPLNACISGEIRSCFCTALLGPSPFFLAFHGLAFPFSLPHPTSPRLALFISVYPQDRTWYPSPGP